VRAIRGAAKKYFRIDATRRERVGLFATLSLFARPVVIVTLYDGRESSLVAGEEFQRFDFRVLQDKGKVTRACMEDKPAMRSSASVIAS